MSNLDIEVNDLEGFDGTALDPATIDPTLHYRWVQNRPANIAKKKMRGYRIVSRSKDKVRPLVDFGESVDDSFRFGDLILMVTTMDNYRSRVTAKRRMITERLDSTKQRLAEKVEQLKSQGLRVSMTDTYADTGPKMEDEE